MPVLLRMHDATGWGATIGHKPFLAIIGNGLCAFLEHDAIDLASLKIFCRQKTSLIGCNNFKFCVNISAKTNFLFPLSAPQQCIYDSKSANLMQIIDALHR
ncbi:hypothetical protein QN379_04625 [Glaciimonas sp. Gout2]|uniref:hypothetical protein n=1 Tax=unclassified Glaciimonas TaxID=2644401 RepID=UPI002AB47A7B|nr:MULTISPECIES: hypothetical protein [unclassified Glaciimonas]MDY7545851.1 hypothetical protein [Glaciimonas sp. CA11.2]MEB0011503.1 hypothetical protein [Glaciimonas sp. Cout2]MEB0081300.1 hypothetical protein [Glaciimonas sp. Gout2]